MELRTSARARRAQPHLPAPRAIPARPLRLHGTVAQEIGMAIVSGRLRPGHVLDTEVEASTKLDVSRSAYREAIRILSAKGLIYSRPRTGTRVSAISEWHLLDPDVLSWMFRGEPRPSVIHGVFELRRMVEPPAAALAAARRTQQQLDVMQQALEKMAIHTLHDRRGREADSLFHATLLAATNNPFVISMSNGVTAAVNSLTEYKLRMREIDRDPVNDHYRVYDAIAAKNPAEAEKAMARLIRLAILDLPVKLWPKSWR